MERVDRMNVKGTYIFYENGKEICRQDNLLTKFGKRFLTSYLAGTSDFNSKDIAVGIGSNAATVNDSQLGFEFYRSAVNLGTVDIQTDLQTGSATYAVVYKTTLPTDVVGIISEVGLFPTTTKGNTDYTSRYITTFENNLAWTDSTGSNATTVTTPTPLIGLSWFSLTAAASQSKEYSLSTQFDISGYSQNDSLSLAFRQNDTNLDYVYVRFYSSTSDYYEIRFSGYAQSGNHILPLTLNNLYNSGYGNGTVDPQNIIKITVGAKAKSSGSTTVLLDGLRIKDEDSFNSTSSIISRSVLTSPITKVYGREIDIEYRIGLSFS